MKKLILILAMISCTVSMTAQQMQYHLDDNSHLLTRITVKGDYWNMNWLISPDGKKYPWIDKKYQWGNMKNEVPQGLYRVAIQTSVRRWFQGHNIVEEYTIENLSDIPVDMAMMRICTPWNARYLAADTVTTVRCSVQVLTKEDGNTATGVKATRLSGQGPHVGLMVTKGAIGNYVTGDCDDLSMNSQCGVMWIIPEHYMLKPKKKYVMQWHIFAYKDTEEFIWKAKKITGSKTVLNLK